jgi:hypothetical protein
MIKFKPVGVLSIILGLLLSHGSLCAQKVLFKSNFTDLEKTGGSWTTRQPITGLDSGVWGWSSCLESKTKLDSSLHKINASAV